MTTLRNKKPNETYKELLKINGPEVDETLRDVESGDGITTPLQLATDKIALQGKQWPVTGGDQGSVLQVGTDPTKLEWKTPTVTTYLTTSFFPGNLGPLVGTARWYPGKPVTIKSVFMSVSGAPTQEIIIDVKKSGASIFGATKPSIISGSFTSTIMALNVSLQSTDYLTVDIISGNGQDMVVRFEYQ